MRIVKDINAEWKFVKIPKDKVSELLDVTKFEFDDSSWEKVNLPHTYNDKDGASGRTGICEGGEHYYRGLVCYRKRLYLPSEQFAGKKIYIEFGAVNTVAEVYVNDSFVGKHEGGFSAFRFDITQYVELGKENLLAVKASNAPTDYIPPITNQGDFTKMGGIYRDVKLIAVNPIHIDMEDYGSSGVYITPKGINAQLADIDVCVKLAGAYDKTCVRVELFDGAGKIVAHEEVMVFDTKTVNLSLMLEMPVLWDGIKNPYLYTAKIALLNDENLCDEVVQSFGVRSYHVDSEKGFFLNGKYLDLCGVNYHQDSWENGWAMNDEQRNRDFGIMRKMGCSAVRMAHYQHAASEYDICDKLGLVVWTEIGIVNKMSPDDGKQVTIAEGFAENAKQQLRELIRQNYNHPCICFWGISNELYQMSDEIYELYEELYEIACSEDPYRIKTFADSQFWGRFLELPGDVVGYNRYFGWYKEAGPAEKFGQWLDLYHMEKESRPLCVSEYGGGSAITQHKDNIDWENEIDPWGERHYENYQSAMHEKIWAQFAQRPYLWGKFIWCMFDFASDGREEGDTKGLNDKGLATRERKQKDTFYFYKSVWNEEPMLYITEKRFQVRPNEVPLVKIYSNAEVVELFVNGVSCGKVKKHQLPQGGETVFTWRDIKLTKGQENHISAIAQFAEGKQLSDTTVWIGK